MGYATMYLSIHLLMNVLLLLLLFQFLLNINTAAINISDKCLCGHTLSFILGKCPAIEYLGHKVYI